MDLNIDHLDGRNLFVKTSDVIQPDSIYKISGEGMTREDRLYINFKVVLPNKLSDERKMYIKKLIQTKEEDHSNLQQSTPITKEIKFLDELGDIELKTITKKINKLNVGNESYSGDNHNQSRSRTSFFEEDSFEEDQVPACNQQ